jgi:hypothetical protein
VLIPTTGQNSQEGPKDEGKITIYLPLLQRRGFLKRDLDLSGSQISDQAVFTAGGGKDK